MRNNKLPKCCKGFKMTEEYINNMIYLETVICEYKRSNRQKTSPMQPVPPTYENPLLILVFVFQLITTIVALLILCKL